MPLRRQQPALHGNRDPGIRDFAVHDGVFQADFQPLSGITTRMFQARNICATGCRRPSRFLEGTSIPNSVIRRELDTPTPDEEHRAWIDHVMNTVAPRIISRLQRNSKPNVPIEEPAPFERSALPTVSEMALQREREEACRLEKEAQCKLAAKNEAEEKRSTIAFGKRSTQECIAEAISRSKAIQDMITAKVLGQTFHEAAPSMEIIRDASDNYSETKSNKRGKRKRKFSFSDNQSTSSSKATPKEDRVFQLIHSIKAGTAAELAKQRNSLSTELKLMKQYRTDLENRAFNSGLQISESSITEVGSPDENRSNRSKSGHSNQIKKVTGRSSPKMFAKSRSPPSINNAPPSIIPRQLKRSPDRCCRLPLTPHITNIGLDTNVQAAINSEKYGPTPKILQRKIA